MTPSSSGSPIVLSIGIMAWNEEKSILTTLRSLFEQSAFEKFAARHQRCEILVLANGCTDRTVPVATAFFDSIQREHPSREGFVTRVIDIPEPGRNNAWNRFVHEFSARETHFIALMDADIVFHHVDTIYNLVATMERHPNVCATSGRQLKELMFKPNKTLWERLSLGTSEMTGTIAGRISGQLYCMRASIARNLYLPRDLSANDDGFFRAAICSDFFSRDVDPRRIALAPDAAHIFEAYIKLGDILRNQTRQMIGQTGVHVLIEYVKTLSFDERQNLAETLRRHEARNPDWLKKMIADHVRRQRYFWRLFPGILTFRFKRLAKLPGAKKITRFPAACAGLMMTLAACWRAHSALRAGGLQYWPKPTRESILALPKVGLNK
jgi:glycosyltransferase involved in cell wall biosynthesis